MNIQELRELVCEVCRINDTPQAQMWRTPLVTTAIADERFALLPKIAASNHLLPHDMLQTCKAVIVYFIPFTSHIANENIPDKFPSKNWALAKSATNTVLQKVGQAIEHELRQSGYASVLTPPTYNYDSDTLTAQWSHKHVGYISGMGRFGINAQLITPAGCAGRLGSVITEAPFGDHPVVAEDELCLEKKGVSCSVCMRNCPVNAVTAEGINRKQCNKRLMVAQKRFVTLDAEHSDGDACGKCATGTPCSLQAPEVAIL